jgi:hypothetical protein
MQWRRKCITATMLIAIAGRSVPPLTWPVPQLERPAR